MALDAGGRSMMYREGSFSPLYTYDEVTGEYTLSPFGSVVVVLQRIATKPRFDYTFDDHYVYRNLPGNVARALPVAPAVPWRILSTIRFVLDLPGQLAVGPPDLVMLTLDNALEEQVIVEVVGAGRIALDARSQMGVRLRPGDREIRVGRGRDGSLLEGYRITVPREDSAVFLVYDIASANSYTIEYAELKGR